MVIKYVLDDEVLSLTKKDMNLIRMPLYYFGR